MKKLLIVLLTSFVLGCGAGDDGGMTYNPGNPGSPGEPSNPGNPGNPGEPGNPGGNMGVMSAKLYDDDDNFLGYCIPGGHTITVFSTKGYFYELQWDGKVRKGFVYFPEVDGDGTAFYASSYTFYAKQIVKIESEYYTYQPDTNGNAVANESITHYKSLYNGGTITNTVSSGIPLTAGNKAYPLVLTDRATAGIPENIPIPLKIKWEEEQ
jgi:hypothetical protein